MQVRLKVVGGKNNGREIKIAVPEFVIGRGEDAHLKPSSDLISRRHCTLRIEGGKVTVEDQGSRNGTFINGQQITGPYNPVSGDILRVGQLQFEIVVDYAEPSNKRSKVDRVGQAVERTAETKNNGDNLEESISDWLADAEDSAENFRETTMLSLDETRTILAEAERKAREKLMAQKRDSGDLSSVSETPSAEKGTGPSKLPNRPKFSHDSSKVAADDVLRRFFNRR